ncbi:hypothetical protein LTR70_000269 [Exophiala xenobiotica]|nr:hypothetical protein LTR70_000269 [Exophiala xenobiotica]
MDPLSAVAASTQVAVYCTKCIISITKWINLVRTVDQRLEDFKQEVSILEQTYKNLRADLKKPTLIEAAREADISSGGQLWRQVTTTLENCDETLKAMMAVLEDINKVPGSGRFAYLRSSVMRQLNESLNSGDLLRLRMRIPLFNSSLVSTMQMINITLQLHHHDLSTANQNMLLKEIAALRQSVEYLTSSGPTLPNRSATEDTVYANLRKYTATIKTFLSDASARASERSGGSTILGQPLTATGQANINDWVQLPEQNEGPGDSEPLNYDTIDLRLTLGYIQNGQADAEGGNFSRAESNFRAALGKLDQNGFGDRLDFGHVDIQLLLSECCLKQEKYDESIERLKPIADGQASRDVDQGSSPLQSDAVQSVHGLEPGLKLTACHILADAYLRKSDFVSGEKYAREAFRGRNRLLGLSSLKTRESIKLLINVYEAMGDTVHARAHDQLLQPQMETVSDVQSRASEPAPTPVSESFELVAVPSHETQHTVAVTEPARRTRISRFLSWRKLGSSASSSQQPLNHNLPAMVMAGAVVQEPQGAISPVYSSQSGSAPHVHGHGNLDRNWYTPIYPSAPAALTAMHESNHTTTDHTSAALSISPNLPQSLDMLFPRFEAIRSFCAVGNFAVAERTRVRSTSEDTQCASKRTQGKHQRGRAAGLTATGHGYAAIHFFCELRLEAFHEVELLLEGRVDVNAVAHKAAFPRKDPFTPLQRAVENNHVNIVRIMLEANVDTHSRRERGNAQVHCGSTHPLLIACDRGHTRIVSILLEHGVTVEDRDFVAAKSWRGNSLLHHACWLGDQQMIELLLEYVLNHKDLRPDTLATIGVTSQQDRWGMTPSMYALDLRGITDAQVRAAKEACRGEYLRILLEHTFATEGRAGMIPVAAALMLKRTEGDATGHSIFCGVLETGDEELTALLKPFAEQCPVEERCAAESRCWPSVLQLRGSVMTPMQLMPGSMTPAFQPNNLTIRQAA